MKTIKDVLDSGLCIGCGLCAVDKKIEETSYNSKIGQYLPILPPNTNNISKETFDICPGKGYDIINLSKKLFENSNTNYSIELGYTNSLFVAHTLSKKVLENASSGGIITQICLYLLDKKIVDKVIVTKFINTKDGPRTKTLITNSKKEILNSQGSKYCPVDISEIINELIITKDKIAFVGTPCQVAGIRILQENYKTFKENIIITISNFCGGFKSYKNIEKIAKRNGIDYKNINFFRFRGGGQPGSMIIKDNHDKSVSIDYPKYTGYSGLSKHLRCHLCVDATGELADISCGDAWLEKYITDKYPWSVIICRNHYATKLINSMSNEKQIVTRNISQDEIIESQITNLKSKKIRQKARMRLYSILGYSIPNFDGGYRDTITSIKTEITVFFKHRLLSFFEYIGIYWWLRKLMRK